MKLLFFFLVIFYSIIAVEPVKLPYKIKMAIANSNNENDEDFADFQEFIERDENNIEAVDAQGTSILFLVAKLKKKHLLAFLISKKINLEAQDIKKHTILVEAVLSPDFDLTFISDLIGRGVNVDAKDEQGISAREYINVYCDYIKKFPGCDYDIKTVYTIVYQEYKSKITSALVEDDHMINDLVNLVADYAVKKTDNHLGLLYNEPAANNQNSSCCIIL